jgi:hypothetical protein
LTPLRSKASRPFSTSFYLTKRSLTTELTKPNVGEQNFVFVEGVNYRFHGNSVNVPSVGNGITIDGKLIIDNRKVGKKKSFFYVNE